MAAKETSLRKFIHYFGENTREEKKFCFILGAGASKSSGIKTGEELVEEWVKKIKEADLDDFTKWAGDNGINENDCAAHYPEIFEKRFEFDIRDGYAELERAMDNKEPSCGYSALAQLLALGKHNIVFTTNFDSLTEDALFIYTQKKPLVVGHWALAGYIKENPSRLPGNRASGFAGWWKGSTAIWCPYPALTV